MLSSFFHLASVSPTRRRAFRLLAVGHALVVAVVVLGKAASGNWANPEGLGNTLLIAGIVEGALLLGWRLTQLPKSQALEFLLVTQLEPWRLLLAEALVGVWRFALVTSLNVPVVVGLWMAGSVDGVQAAALLTLPLAWGLATGLGLAAWAYEPVEVRVWGERIVMAGVLVYLVVGVLIGETLPRWLAGVPEPIARAIFRMMLTLHEDNPFGAMRSAMLDPARAGPGVALVALIGTIVAGVSLVRAMIRLLPHFHDLHYRPELSREDRPRPEVGDRPLSWWAVKRVGNYSGRINLWLAGSFTLAYSAFLLAGPAWPAWLGRNVFLAFEHWGGIPMLATSLVLLAAVPAAFQYGLWDQNAQDRCRRLELLLLTDLDGRAYWDAALAAAWSRGSGYFLFAGLLWVVGWITGAFSLSQVVLAASAAAVVWGLYFTLGFWSFSRGVQSSSLGLILTLALPLATIALSRFGHETIAEFLPPGSLYFARGQSLAWGTGLAILSIATLLLARLSLRSCDASLRLWYDRNQGIRVVD